MEVVDLNEFDDFIFDYEDLVESISQSYLCNYENYIHLGTFVGKTD